MSGRHSKARIVIPVLAGRAFMAALVIILVVASNNASTKGASAAQQKQPSPPPPPPSKSAAVHRKQHGALKAPVPKSQGTKSASVKPSYTVEYGIVGGGMAGLCVASDIINAINYVPGLSQCALPQVAHV